MSQEGLLVDAKARQIERQKSVHAMFVAWKRVVLVTTFLYLLEVTLPVLAPAQARSMSVLVLSYFSLLLAAHYLEMRFDVPAVYWWMGIFLFPW